MTKLQTGGYAIYQNEQVKLLKSAFDAQAFVIERADGSKETVLASQLTPVALAWVVQIVGTDGTVIAHSDTLNTEAKAKTAQAKFEKLLPVIHGEVVLHKVQQQ